MIAKRTFKILILFPIFVVVGLILLILGLTLFHQIIPYSIAVLVLGFLLGIYILVIYYKVSNNFNQAYDTLSMGGELEYEVSVSEDKLVIHNLSLNQVMTLNLSDIDMIYKNKKAYIVFCKDGLNFLVANNEEGKELIETIKPSENQ